MGRMTPRCYWCEIRVKHPWHNDGTPRPEDQVDYKPGGRYARPLYDGEKRKP